MLPLSFEGSCRSTLDVTCDRSALRGRNPQAQLAGRPIDGGGLDIRLHLYAPLAPMLKERGISRRHFN